VPDIYQGCELFEFRLVDPDNRVPVDYVSRRTLLDSLEPLLTASGDVAVELRALLETPEDGRAKLYLTARLLRLRRERAVLFESGLYRPLDTEGAAADKVCSFCRCGEDGSCAVVVAPCRFGALSAAGTRMPLGPAAWGDTVLVLPDMHAQARAHCAPQLRWHEVLTGRRFMAEPGGEGGERLHLGRLLDSFPVALLLCEASA
jgi:(1->4)-alpha-D-glucan 1-alpha-D-glucosylmutase